MIGIRPALARQLDRLARRAHSFHRFAHHPLCAPYAGEVFRLGRRTRVCRGCALVALGAALGALAGAAGPRLPGALLGAALAVAGPLGVATTRSARRSSKLLTRALPAACAGAVAAAGLRAGGGLGFAVAGGVVAVSVVAARAYRQRGPDREPCRRCPERGAPSLCSGFRPLARREAAFGRLAGRWIAADEQQAR